MQDYTITFYLSLLSSAIAVGQYHLMDADVPSQHSMQFIVLLIQWKLKLGRGIFSMKRASKQSSGKRNLRLSKTMTESSVQTLWSGTSPTPIRQMLLALSSKPKIICPGPTATMPSTTSLLHTLMVPLSACTLVPECIPRLQLTRSSSTRPMCRINGTLSLSTFLRRVQLALEATPLCIRVDSIVAA